MPYSVRNMLFEMKRFETMKYISKLLKNGRERQAKQNHFGVRLFGSVSVCFGYKYFEYSAATEKIVHLWRYCDLEVFRIVNFLAFIKQKEICLLYKKVLSQ